MGVLGKYLLRLKIYIRFQFSFERKETLVKTMVNILQKTSEWRASSLNKIDAPTDLRTTT